MYERGDFGCLSGLKVGLPLGLLLWAALVWSVVRLWQLAAGA